MGWCFGGAWSLQTGLLAGADLAAVVMYYGARRGGGGPKLAGLQAPLLVSSPTRMPITPRPVNAFEAALKAAGKTATVLPSTPITPSPTRRARATTRWTRRRRG
ncbi:MAG: dienelactone hydrolase family protein [bacterium]